MIFRLRMYPKVTVVLEDMVAEGSLALRGKHTQHEVRLSQALTQRHMHVCTRLHMFKNTSMLGSLNPQPSTLNPQASTRNPSPQTRNP